MISQLVRCPNRFITRISGVEFGARLVNIDGVQVKLQIWDTYVFFLSAQCNLSGLVKNPSDLSLDRIIEAQQVHYLSMISLGKVRVIDSVLTSRRETFNHLTRWLQEVRLNGNPSMTIMLIGNKVRCDQSRNSVHNAEKTLHGINTINNK